MNQKTFFEAQTKERIVSVSVSQDECTAAACEAFDVEFDGTSKFERWGMPKVEQDFELGVIVGPSGTGKTLLLNEFGSENEIQWDPGKAIVSQFANKEEAFNRLTAVGLNSIPSWLRPFHVLSNGEQYRAKLARVIKSDSVVDEFTSVVDRSVAKAMSAGVRRLIRREKFQRVVLATCHYDVLDWLEPDWWFDTAGGRFARGCLRRPSVKIGVHEADGSLWSLFAPYHYLSAKMNRVSGCYVGTWGDSPVVFTAVLPFPTGTIHGAWREHRTVVLPDYQGLGIGVRFSDAIGEIMHSKGRRFYSRTMHPRMGEYRERSPKWRTTSSSQKKMQRGNPMWEYAVERLGFSHEYIGEGSNYENVLSDLLKQKEKRRGELSI